MVDTLSKKQRSYCMSRIRSKDTKIELLLRRILFKNGLRFRVHYKDLPGKPDIVFTKQKIVIFVDGDFWHGRNFEKRKHTYSEYWLRKIKRNIDRDKEIDSELFEKGWTVLRIWGKDLKKDSEKYAEEIEMMVKK